MKKQIFALFNLIFINFFLKMSPKVLNSFQSILLVLLIALRPEAFAVE